MTDGELLVLRTEALGRVTTTLDRVTAFAKSNAIAAHALGRSEDERRWLDLLAIVERTHPLIAAPATVRAAGSGGVHLCNDGSNHAPR